MGAIRGLSPQMPAKDVTRTMTFVLIERPLLLVDSSTRDVLVLREYSTPSRACQGFLHFFSQPAMRRAAVGRLYPGSVILAFRAFGGDRRDRISRLQNALALAVVRAFTKSLDGGRNRT